MFSVEEGPEATANAAEMFVACALAERDRAAAEQALSYVPKEGVISNIAKFPHST